MGEESGSTSQPERPAGLSELVIRYGLSAIPHWHESAVSPTYVHRLEERDGRTRDVYPIRRWPGDTLADHLEFALKYDGINLATLSELFTRIPEDELLHFVRAKPRGKYARRTWFLYEMLTGRRLDLPDLRSTPYVDLLDPGLYYTSKGRRSKRHAIRDNLLGDARFCPMVRRSSSLSKLEAIDFGKRCLEVIGDYPEDLLSRALSYLYTKETRSSFEIERVTPSRSRTERFIESLRLAEKDDFFDRPALLALQNQIVDERYRNRDYRQSQNFVGSAVISGHERVHYISPKPTDLPDLMEGMFACHARMAEGAIHPVVHAAVIAFGLVFAHPFEDGNGRIHRFLIHNILARRGLTPEGVIFPVSATMLRERVAYDEALEAFSRPLMRLLEYAFDDESRLVVAGDTARHYRFIDMTAQVEALFRFVRETIETDLVEELEFLRSYDEARSAIQQIVDLPDRQLDMFIRFCLQNHGRLSIRKRASHFAELTDAEVEGMAAAVRAGYRIGDGE